MATLSHVRGYRAYWKSAVCLFIFPFYDPFCLLTFLFWFCRWHEIPAGQVLFIVLVYIKYLNHWKTLSWSEYFLVPVQPAQTTWWVSPMCRSALPCRVGLVCGWCNWRPGSFSWVCHSSDSVPVSTVQVSHMEMIDSTTLFQGVFYFQDLAKYWLNKQKAIKRVESQP